jgi:long-chain acyl-CoA synthetase
VKIDKDGEILCKGPNVMLGYYNEPELTKEIIDEDGWLHTGDIGEIVDDKYLKITDRKKEIFKLSSGKYIAPQVIENKFKESFFIEQIMVVGENEKFASALISPNFQFLHNWCTLHGIKYRDNNELISNPKVVARYQREVNEMNSKLGQTEQIKRFRMVSEEWSTQTGELSPTLKLKRKFLYEKYSSLLREIFSMNANNSFASNGSGSEDPKK